MSFLNRTDPIDLRTFPNLNARAMAFITAPGGGKTAGLSEFFKAVGVNPDLRAVLAFDPAGELSRRVDRDGTADVWEVEPGDVEDDLPALWRALGDRLRRGKSVCFNLKPAGYDAPPKFVDRCLPHVEGVPDLLILAEEGQRIIPQDKNPGYSYRFRQEVELGRNDRHGRVVASQRIASVCKEVFARCDTLLLGRLQDATDVDAVRNRLKLNIPNPQELDATIRAMLDLDAGEFILREPRHLPGVNK